MYLGTCMSWIFYHKKSIYWKYFQWLGFSLCLLGILVCSEYLSTRSKMCMFLLHVHVLGMRFLLFFTFYMYDTLRCKLALYILYSLCYPALFVICLGHCFHDLHHQIISECVCAIRLLPLCPYPFSQFGADCMSMAFLSTYFADKVAGLSALVSGVLIVLLCFDCRRYPAHEVDCWSIEPFRPPLDRRMFWFIIFLISPSWKT